MPSTITTIGFGAFRDNQLSGITIPENTVSIETWAFLNNQLTTVVSLNTTPPSFVLTSNVDAFDSRQNINLFIPKGTTAAYTSNSGAEWTGFNSVTEMLGVSDTFVVNNITYEVTSIMPNEVKVVDYNTAGGTDITIPTTVTNFPISYSVTSIGNNSFLNKQLTSVVIPNTVINIGNGAFENNNLTNIIIPENIEGLGNRVFWGNPLNTVSSKNAVPPIIINQSNADTFGNNRSSIDLFIPYVTTAVYTIDPGALWTGFNSVTEELVVGDVFTVGFFIYTVAALSPNRVSISDYNMAGGTNVNIPATVTFNNVLYNVTIIGSNAFQNKQLTNVSIPEGITTIGNFAFADNQLNTVFLPSSINLILSYAFLNNNLTSITLPLNFSSIQISAFNVNPLNTIISLNTMPPSQFTPSSDAFGNRSNIDLFIPAGTLALYDTNSGGLWAGFNSVTEGIPLSVSDFELDNEIVIIPSKDEIKVLSSNTIKLNSYTIYSIAGVIVSQSNAEKGNIAIDDLSSGIYILKLTFDKGEVIKKIAK